MFMLFSPEITDDVILAHYTPFGPRTLAHLRERGLDATRLFLVDRQEMIQTGLAEKKIDDFFAWRSTCDRPHLLEILEASRIQAVRDDQAHYPALLRHIHDAPRVLFFWGTLHKEQKPTVAVVGSRAASAYGLDVARLLGHGLAQAGATVVSGLARGIDETVARAVLDAQGYTVAVLGSGVLANDTSRSRAAMRAIIDGGGAIISEFAPHIPPLPTHFPRRNRIIAGMSTATVVVEGALKSGSLITARLALEENREVFAVPGPITSPSSAGTNALLQQGAQVCTGTADILRALGLVSPEEPTARTSHGDAAQDPLLCHLLFEPLAVDELSARSGIPAHDVQVMLTMLELEGKIVQTQGLIRLK